MQARWFLLLALLGLMVACNTEPLETDGQLESGQTIDVKLPASGSVFLTLHASGPTRVFAHSRNPEGAELRIILSNQDLNRMVASASHSWFGIPDVAPASAGAAPLIVVEPASGPRLNFHASRGYDYYLKIENYSHQEVEAVVGAFEFTPLKDGNIRFYQGSTTGALEFLGEVDSYIVGEDGVLSLAAGGSGYAWIVADVYTSSAPGSAKIATLEPGGPSLSVKAENYVLVRARGHIVAGFNEADSFQYRLELSR